ncbi:uncharacterized protein P174DRAFT_93553 [Aspergillus novofumigatus IBT 16806]|uniref:Uncharacterized protein n=1 Tax=Aspergillus novofumigatus (strain IBT 16806) TaxID=1392255 RepID=A0A2I1CGZ2_ASPN1|nr:uncharacterized protein P174DRAFT_93553 [Aspergillus novofumigatus IBT 16806]PKX96860.1 hypothetical protein P174DRAFT_93553 [Aspergillus novofumigatus IBT 16806]
MGKLRIILKIKNSRFQKDSFRQIMSKCVCESVAFRGSLRRRGRQRLEKACRVNIRSASFITIAQPNFLNSVDYTNLHIIEKSKRMRSSQNSIWRTSILLRRYFLLISLLRDFSCSNTFPLHHRKDQLAFANHQNDQLSTTSSKTASSEC